MSAWESAAVFYRPASKAQQYIMRAVLPALLLPNVPKYDVLQPSFAKNGGYKTWQLQRADNTLLVAIGKRVISGRREVMKCCGQGRIKPSSRRLNLLQAIDQLR